MSIESAEAFLERMKNDEDYRKSVGEVATSKERMEYVKGAGFDFTKDEIAIMKDIYSDINYLVGPTGCSCKVFDIGLG